MPEEARSSRDASYLAMIDFIMPGRILIIEDERKTAGFLRRGFTENDFSVEVRADGDSGLSRALTGEYYLVIFDVMLPERDSWSIISDTHPASQRTTGLLLTAQ